jgi:hypothetical protein
MPSTTSGDEKIEPTANCRSTATRRESEVAKTVCDRERHVARIATELELAAPFGFDVARDGGAAVAARRARCRSSSR